MMILKAMECREAGFVVVFVILLFSLAIADSGEKQNTITTFLDNEGGGGGVGSGRETLQIHEKMAEQAWIHCRKELIDKEEFDSHLPNAVSKMMNSELLTRRRRYRSVEDQPLYDCLKRRNILVSRSSEDGKSWFTKCLQLFFGWPTSPRRELISKSRPLLAPSSAPSPSEAPSPSFSPSPENAPSPDSAAPSPSFSAPVIPPSPDLQPPVEAPAPLAPSHWINDDMAPPPKHHPPLPQAAPSLKKQEVKNMAAIAATTGGAVIVMSLILCCCVKNNAYRLDNGQKDDKPLLILSSSDFSGGSSQNSSIREFSPSTGKNPAFASSLSIKPETKTSMAVAESSDAIPAVPFPPLKLPPGRSASQPPDPPAPPPPAPSRQPPPPSKAAACPPPLPPTMPGKTKLPSSVPHSRRTSASSEGKNDDDDDSASQKAKLKPFFWDKVLTNPDQSMVWHDISSGSFQFSEEMIESLFSYANVNNNKIDRRKDPSSSLDPSSIQYIQIIDPKKAQNLSILLRALNVTTEDVVDALKEGTELPVELLQTLLKMAPTTDEELKLRLFTGDLSQLGPAERFLKVLVEIPFAFKRIDSLLFRCSLPEEISGIKDSFATLEVACKKLRNSRLFLKLLEAVLKTGNRMNDGTYRGSAQAFKLDTLLKLADVKGADGKTTLLHFVVQEIIRSEGVRAARTAKETQSISSINSGEYSDDPVDEAADHYRQLGLQVVSGLSAELEDVKKASVIDPDNLKTTVSRLCNSHVKLREFLGNEMQSLDGKSEFYNSLTSFVAQKEADIMEILEEEKRIRSLVKSTGDYFHGNSGKDEGLRLFAIVRDFLIMLDKSCKEVRDGAISTTMKRHKKASVENRRVSDIHSRLFPAIAGRRMDESSSDEETSSSPSEARNAKL